MCCAASGCRSAGEDGTTGTHRPDGRLTLHRDDGTTVLMGSGEVELSDSKSDA